MTSRLVSQLGQSLVNDEGIPSAKFSIWLTLINLLEILDGSGSPEGVVEATFKRLYMDTDEAVTTRLYIKRVDDILGDRTKGWVEIA